MTSRERILTALRHQEADRVPVDLGAMRSSGIHAIAYNRLKAHLGIAGGETRLYDIMQQLAEPEPGIVDRFGLDCLPLPRAVMGLDPAQPRWKPWRLPDGSPALIPDGLEQWPRADGGLEIRDDAGHVLYHMPAGGLYYEPVYEPLADATTVAEIEAWQPSAISDVELAWLRGEAQRLRATSDKAILGLTGINIYEGAQRARGWQRFMEDLAGAPALAQALLSRLAEAAISNLARYLDAVGEYIDIVQVGDDLGTQNGPQLSPRMYRRLVKPYQAQVWQFIRAYSGLPLFLHCCGGIYPLIPDLIEAGVDILNPVQISAGRHGPCAAQGRVWPRSGLLGRRLRYATRFARGNSAAGRRPRAPTDRDPGARRRVYLQPGAQHSSQRAAGEHRRYVGRGVGVWRLRRVGHNVMLSGLTNHSSQRRASSEASVRFTPDRFSRRKRLFAGFAPQHTSWDPPAQGDGMEQM